jgi:hypothetical protein
MRAVAKGLTRGDFGEVTGLRGDNRSTHGFFPFRRGDRLTEIYMQEGDQMVR